MSLDSSAKTSLLVSSSDCYVFGFASDSLFVFAFVFGFVKLNININKYAIQFNCQQGRPCGVYYQPAIVSKMEDTLSLADFVTPSPWKGILPIGITTG